jgi:hypothetical protein
MLPALEAEPIDGSVCVSANEHVSHNARPVDAVGHPRGAGRGDRAPSGNAGTVLGRATGDHSITRAHNAGRNGAGDRSDRNVGRTRKRGCSTAFVARLRLRCNLLQGPVGPFGPGGLPGGICRCVDVPLRRVQRLVPEQRLDLGGRRVVFGEAGGEGVSQSVDRPAGRARLSRP